MPRPLDPVRVLRRRARRAHLDRSGADAPAVARALVALHATDPASLHLTVHARIPIAPIAAFAVDLRRRLEDERSLVRLLGMRRTVHVVDTAIAPAVLTLARERLEPERRKDAVKYLAQAEAPSLDALRSPVLDALGDGDLDTDALQARVPDLARRVALAAGKPYAGEAAVGRYVLEALGTAGAVVRARTLAGWRSNRTTWARMDAWMPGLAATPPKGEAYATLARAWLAAFGPGTLDDLAWWMGVPKGDVRAALTMLGNEVRTVEVAGWGERLALASETLEDDGPPIGPAFLPALDPSAMCGTERRFLDPDHAAPLFDRSGNIGPTVWVDGRVVGGWACRRDGSVAFALFDRSVDEDAVRAEAARLQDALAGEVVQPRFPTPLSKELAG